MYGPDHSWMFGGGGMVLGSLWMVLILGIPLLLLFALLKYLFAKPTRDGSQEDSRKKQTPLDILKETYARGTISREEYLLRRDDLLEK